MSSFQADYLPFPPSINHYWRRVGARTLISRQGREYRRRMQAIEFRRLVGRVRVVIRVLFPDRRRRDLDNLIKPLLDALTHGGAWEDDSQVKDLHIVESGIDPDHEGYVNVFAEELP